MSSKQITGTLLGCLGINLLLLLAAAILDILLSALLPRFSSRASTFVCFAVAGVFSAACCYAVTMDRIVKELQEPVARLLVLFLIILCVLLFTVIAAMSGWEYNGPVKFYAVAQSAMVLFFWKTKIYR